MVERGNPGLRRRRVGRALAGVVAVQTFVAPFLYTRDSSSAEAFQGRAAVVAPAAVNEIPIFIPPLDAKTQPKLVEVGEKTEYTQVSGTLVAIDPRPYITFVVIKQDSGDFLHISFWDENVDKGHKNPTAKYRNGTHGLKRKQQVTVAVPTGKISQQEAEEFKRLEIAKGSTAGEADILLSGIIYGNNLCIEPLDYMRESDQYVVIKSNGLNPAK